MTDHTAPRRRGERRGRLPGPVRRLFRQPLRVGAVGLLALTALAASGVQSAAAIALQSTLDENWRGLYDILVTPAGAMHPVDGMLPPNGLASGEEGLSLDDLAHVRGVDGVQIAAPVGEIVVPGLRFSSPQVVIPPRFVGGSGEAPQAFRVTATYTTNDGLGDRMVARLEFTIIVDETSGSRADECTPTALTFSGRNGEYLADPSLYPHLVGGSCMVSQVGDGVTMLHDSGYMAWATDPAGALTFNLPSAPQTMTRITLIDPVAERALLGDAGAFLDPLVGVKPSGELTTDDVTEWAQAQATPDDFVRRIRDDAAARAEASAPDEAWLAEVRALYAAHGDDYDTWVAQEQARLAYQPAIPLLATAESAAQLSVKLDVTALGAASVAAGVAGSAGLGEYVLPTATAGVAAGSTVTDVSDLLNPFAARAPGVVWPGADLGIADQAPDWTTLDIGRLFAPGAAVFRERGGDGISLGANGFTAPQREWSDVVGASASQLLAADPAVVGAESAYAGLRDQWQGAMDGSSITAVPVGAFDPDTLDLDAEAANYVPLGAYAPVGSTLADGPHAGARVQPSLSGLGLVSPRTVAIGSIESAPIWGAETPIGAIRVRVGGIDGYGPDAQRRVIEVAQAIEDLGFAASIVAGSSPVDAGVHVDGYAFGTTDPDGSQSVGELGTITQRWSELGAAARVELSVSAATLSILGIALAAGVLLLGAVQLAGVPARRRQAVVMREVGFTRVRIARWFALEELPGLAIVAAVGAAAWWISGGTGITAIAGASAAGATLVVAVGAVIASSRVMGPRMPRDVRSRRLGARSVAAFGSRQALVHPLSSVIHVVAIAIVGVAAAALASAVLAGRDAAGQSSLALLVTGRQLLPQLALGSAGAAGGILLAVLTRRIGLADRADQWSALRAAGWTRRQLALAQRTEGVAIGVPGLLVSAAAVWLGAARVGLGHPILLTAIAVLGGLVTVGFAFSTRREGTS
ncbi:hypothetical protein [Microbacterium ulmi]|uniref:FtsX-like permease family protein n=1 Tax=Microbacterium ulmi TaxID=179095 RepID=A0A7Y2M356_9MICO|nr:hypothetical protein [Microbacterium ulmi]NII69485.1 hypothetical protein [Microbacterium ulmi]NNH04914.1 hypothetical protein [Microbacterium ulmi]